MGNFIEIPKIQFKTVSKAKRVQTDEISLLISSKVGFE